MAKVFFRNQNINIQVRKNTTILEASILAGLVLEAPCSGNGTCGKCKVKIRPEDKKRIRYLGGQHKVSTEEESEVVLACRAKVIGDIEVTFENTEKQNETLKILNEGVLLNHAIQPYITKKFDGSLTFVYGGEKLLGAEQGDTTESLYGLAVDIGTTTLVASLVDLNTGKEAASASALNPQSLQAQDVLTRIKFASTPEGLKMMHEAIILELNRMVSELCEESGVSRKDIYEAVYSGNTAMIHLTGNRNPESLGKYPYTPVLYGGCYDPASENGINISPFGLVYFPPVISAYVGPDITSGILSAGLLERQGTNLFIDVGTNGEMVIGKEGSLSATSTAAGPAFEGMNITFGMRAAAGAIEYFEISSDRRIEIRTIGGGKAKGICGSGLFDIVGELVRTGIILKNGRFINKDSLEDADPLKIRLKEYGGKPAFEITEDIYLTLSDIRQVQLAKGAVRSGVTALLENLGVQESDVRKVLIAGSFGYYLRAKSIINIGLLPGAFADRIEFVGNTSKTGARAFLLNREFRELMKKVVSDIDCIELANLEGFQELFISSLSF